MRSLLASWALQTAATLPAATASTITVNVDPSAPAGAQCGQAGLTLKCHDLHAGQLSTPNAPVIHPYLTPN